jgi:hypothetical protein
VDKPVSARCQLYVYKRIFLRNHYHLNWTFSRSFRRIKNVIMVLEYIPSIKEAAVSVIMNTGKINASQEALLLRCFNMFDTDEDGKLSPDDITRVR